MSCAIKTLMGSKAQALYKNASTVQKTYSSKQIQDLPSPVRRYFQYALKENQPCINSLRLKHGGSFRLSPKKEWMKINGEQHFTASPPGFVWQGKTTLFKAYDSYINGEGNLSVYLFGLIRIVNKSGNTVAQAELLRWLGESVWMPNNFLPGENLKWEKIDENNK